MGILDGNTMMVGLGLVINPHRGFLDLILLNALAGDVGLTIKGLIPRKISGLGIEQRAKSCQS
jgi:hypothetical protein